MNYIVYIRDENGVPHPILSLQGLSAYQTWLKQPGNEGKTEQDFLASLKGKPGDIENIEGATVDFVEATSRTNIATGETITTLFGKIKKFFTDLKTVAFTGSYNDLANKPTSMPASDVSDWAKAATKPSYSYSEIGNTPSIPAKVSELTNDKSFQTADQVATAIASLVNGSPEALDTLQELADALGNDPNFSTTVLEKIGNKADKLKPKTATLSAANWVDDSAASGYFIYTVQDADIAQDVVIELDAATDEDFAKFEEFEFTARLVVTVGQFVIRAKKLPVSDIEIIYAIKF